MSHLQLLRLFISERLSVAAEEIFAAVHRTLTEYEQDSEQHRAKHEVHLSNEDVQTVFISAHEPKLWPGQSPESCQNTSEDQEDSTGLVPDNQAIKQEDQELWSSPGEQQLLDVENLSSRTVIEDVKPVQNTFPVYTKVEGKSQSSRKHSTFLPGCSVTLNKTSPEFGSDMLSGCSTSEIIKVSCTERSIQTENCEPHSPTSPNNLKKRRGKSHCCHVSGEEFSQSARLEKHAQVQTEEKIYFCEVCGKRFRHGKSLTPHMKIHKEEKPYSCRFCGKLFRHVGNLNVHLRIHTGEKPFSCLVCGKKFSRNYLMTKHMAIHTS
ncbi:zinc finger protein 480-like isoform X1 [Cheilinus undulatus]|uniref:zinc finger protein 480-like isoform X1 n=1 Tax=Cheilinus undulatus TaxID=241271 RepID=UPI001BD33F2C|nr:zinc finger protein 480-like isoform X1 [Cheilinus undulatus]